MEKIMAERRRGRPIRKNVLIMAGGGILAIVLAAASAGDEWKFRERGESGPRMFRLPVENPEGKLFSGTRWDFPLGLIGVDHLPHPEGSLLDRAFCRDYQGRGFPRCYGNHQGVDFVLHGGFPAMDQGVGRVVAAADGVVTRVEDGHYDRCRMSLWKLDVSCHGHEMKANFVELRHADGYRTLYYHLKKNSIVVRVGEEVKCGQLLGLIGSSGRSSLPHLHFQVVAPDGAGVDPFSREPGDSLWVEQEGPFGLPAEKCVGG